MGGLAELRESYLERKPQIEKRLREFRGLGKRAGGKELFAELCFCLLTPQSKARSCDVAVKKLLAKGKIYSASRKKIAETIRGCVRFHNNKAEYVEEAREKLRGGAGLRAFLPKREGEHEAVEKRNALASSVKGLGMKEASHFLRNVGFGEHIAILDRHVLKNLKRYGAIKSLPGAVSGKKYVELEGRMKKFARKIRIPLSHLDLLFWSEETGEVFK